MRPENWVYFVHVKCGGIRDANAIKIGSAEDPLHRLRDLQIGNPLELEIVALFPNAKETTEYEMHALFEKHLIRGEWFRAQPVFRWLNNHRFRVKYKRRRYETPEDLIERLILAGLGPKPWHAEE